MLGGRRRGMHLRSRGMFLDLRLGNMLLHRLGESTLLGGLLLGVFLHRGLLLVYGFLSLRLLGCGGVLLFLRLLLADFVLTLLLGMLLLRGLLLLGALLFLRLLVLEGGLLDLGIVLRLLRHAIRIVAGWMLHCAIRVVT